MFDDGVAYRLGWKPLYEFTVHEGRGKWLVHDGVSLYSIGEGLLFPPGWIHETFNNADECTSSCFLSQTHTHASRTVGALTTQLEYPAPSTYMREFYSRCRRVGDLGACWDQMVNGDA